MFDRPPASQAPVMESLANVACDRVHPGLRRVTCERRGNVVTLRGEVPTFYLKQLAQEAAAKLDGIRCVENHVQVHPRKGAAGRLQPPTGG